MYRTILYYMLHSRARAREAKNVIQNLETFPRCGHQCLKKVEDGLRTLFT